MNNGDYNLLYYTNNLKTKRTSRNPNLRNNCISVRFNDEELKILNFKRGERSKAEWLRLIALEKSHQLFHPLTMKLGKYYLKYLRS